jgi:hypothetical protein
VDGKTTKGEFKMLIRTREPVPDHVLLDWERRMKAPETINMRLLGDPCFEQSALGKRLVHAR